MKKSLLFLCLGLSSMLVFAGCNKTETVEEPAIQEEVVEEVVEEPVENIEEEEVEEESFINELPLRNDDRSFYYAVITEEQFQAKVDEICDMATSDYERDCMISTLIALNADSMNNELVLKYENEYIDNLNSYDMNYIIMEWDYGNEELPLSFYFIDEKTAEAVDKFEEIVENKDYDLEDVKTTYQRMMSFKYGGTPLGVEGIPMGNLYEYCFFFSGIIPYEEGYGSLHCGSFPTQTALAYYEAEPTPIDEYVSSHQE